MAQTQSTNTYIQGHSQSTLTTQQTRTAESEGAFLLPYIKPDSSILDVGCGPGTITTGFAKYASKGTIVGVDLSAEVLEKAKALAAQRNVSTQGPGSVTFQHGNVLDRLPFADASFDIVFSAQVFGHLPMPDAPLRALDEIRRVLKPGGLLATRDGVSQQFYPSKLNLDQLWVGNFTRAMRKGGPVVEPTGPSMPFLLRRAGFDSDGGKVRLGVGSTVYTGHEARHWLANRALGQLKQGDPFRQSWLDAGISEQEIQETQNAIQQWADTEDAWYAALQCEMLAWK